jgi:hypothetical protein
VASAPAPSNATLQQPTEENADAEGRRVMQAMLKMKKLDIRALKNAYEA